jgi:hypothetical protein
MADEEMQRQRPSLEFLRKRQSQRSNAGSRIEDEDVAPAAHFDAGSIARRRWWFLFPAWRWTRAYPRT